MRYSQIPLLAVAATLAVLVANDVAEAGHRHRSRRRAPRHHSDGYAVLKAGGYGLDNTVDPGADGALFLGAEMGSSLSPYVQVGFTVDWLRRRDVRSEVVLLDTPYDLPVTAVTDLVGTATDLVPVGGLLRLRFPVGDGTFAPFVSGQLTYDLLRLEYREANGNGGFASVETQRDYFHGLGTSVSLGAEARIDRNVAVLVEAGVHESQPSKTLQFSGVPVEARVDAGGEFARLGLRFAFR